MIESTIRKLPDGSGVPLCRSYKLENGKVIPVDPPIRIPISTLDKDGNTVEKYINDPNITVAQFIYDIEKGFWHSVFPYQIAKADFSSGY